MLDVREPDPQWIVGKYALLNIHAKLRNRRTEIDPHSWRIPFQWQGTHYQDHDDQPFLLVINSGGGFVEGDSSELNGMLDPGTRALVTTTAASKYYKCLTGGRCTEVVNFNVGAGALLEYIPDEAIPFAQSRVKRRTTISLTASSRLFATDMISAGRIHYGAGEEFMFSEMQSKFNVLIEGRTAISDRMYLTSVEEVNELKAMWGGARHMATVFCHGADWPAGIEGLMEAQGPPAGINIGCSRIGGIIVARILTREIWQAQEAVFSLWTIVRPLIAGKAARPILKC